MVTVHEEWRPVVGYEGSYEVSSLGRVRSLDRYVTFPSGQRCFKRGAFMRLHLATTGGKVRGYKTVCLSLEGSSKALWVHRVVAAAFFGPSVLEVNHIDFDPSNNAASNLEYVSTLENMRHSAKAGRMVRGSEHRLAKLTEDEVRSIRTLKGKLSEYKLAKRFGVHRSTINAIYSGRSWSHLKD